MTRQLAIVEIDGEKYYDDERLREYRHLERITPVIPYDELGDRKVKVLQEARELLPKIRKRDQPNGLQK